MSLNKSAVCHHAHGCIMTNVSAKDNVKVWQGLEQSQVGRLAHLKEVGNAHQLQAGVCMLPVRISEHIYGQRDALQQLPEPFVALQKPLVGQRAVHGCMPVVEVDLEALLHKPRHCGAIGRVVFQTHSSNLVSRDCQLLLHVVCHHDRKLDVQTGHLGCKSILVLAHFNMGQSVGGQGFTMNGVPDQLWYFLHLSHNSSEST